MDNGNLIVQQKLPQFQMYQLLLEQLKYKIEFANQASGSKEARITE